MTGTRAALVLLALCGTSVTGCRDGVAPYDPGDDRDELAGSPYQLTFNPGDDLNPTWSADSDSVYYSAADFIDSPSQPSSVLRIARGGGIAQLIAPARGSTPVILVLPVLSPKHNRIAFLQLTPFNSPAICRVVAFAEEMCDRTEPLLSSGVLRVRDVVPSGIPSNAEVAITFQGVDPARLAQSATRPVPMLYDQRAFPFQQAYGTRAELLFRPTWSPDGTRLAFSDGLALYLWNADATAAARIPNGEDGVSAAWNPVRNQIAFTRMLRRDSTRTICSCRESDQGLPDTVFPDRHTRWTYVVTPTITLIDPDGTNVVDLTEGAEPAWSPDGETLYFTRNEQIHRIARVGGAATPIAQTQGARSPAVSPDGKWLAFTRGSNANQNVFILSLGAQ